MRTLIVVLLGLLFAAPAWSQSGPIEAEIQAGVKEADALLASLEYQRAREILERLASDRRTREARRSMRARLYVALGRARAELGDDSGMSEAFYDAVALDPTVTLPRGTSPKIVGALERARENAPATAPRGPKTRPEPKPDVKPDVKPDPKPDAKLKPTRTSSRAAGPTVKSSTATATARPPDGTPGLVLRVIGKVQEHARIRVVVDAFGVPRSAKIEARIRTEGSRVYQPYLMPWVVGTATQAALALTLDEPRYEIYVEAKVGKKVVARAGSAADPIVLEPAAVPSLAEAYGTGDTKTATTTRTSTAVAIAPAPVSESEPWTTTEALLLAGGVLAAALIVVVVALAATSGTNNCDVPEGFGCTDVTVRPLLRF